MKLILFVAALFLLASSFPTEAARRRRQRCTKIAIPQCGNRGYHFTVFPNPLTLISTQEETKNLTRFVPELAKMKCSNTDPMPFLCAVYVPKCERKVKKLVIPPCREFCEASIGKCHTLTRKLNMPWPQALLCSNYPSKSSGVKCISGSPQQEILKKAIKVGKKGKNKNKRRTLQACCNMGKQAAAQGIVCKLSRAMQASWKLSENLKKCTKYEGKFQRCCRKSQKKKQKKERKEKKQRRKQLKKLRKLQKKQRKGQRKEQRKNKGKGRKIRMWKQVKARKGSRKPSGRING